MKSPSKPYQTGPGTFDVASAEAALTIASMTYGEYRAVAPLATAWVGKVLVEAEKAAAMLGKPLYDYHLVTLLAAMLIRALEIADTAPCDDAQDETAPDEGEAGKAQLPLFVAVGPNPERQQ